MEAVEQPLQTAHLVVARGASRFVAGERLQAEAGDSQLAATH